MRIIIVFSFIFLFSELIYAQTDTLIFKMSDGKTHSISINSIKKITLGKRTSVKDQKEINKKIDEIRNFPNPANRRTQFTFELNESGNVRIKIYNIQGVEVNSIEVKNCLVGENIVDWNCKDSNNNQLTNGIYIYEVIFKDIHITKKMIILD